MKRRQPWLRLHAETLDNPKVQGLPPTLRCHWLNLLLLSSTCTPRGSLPAPAVIAFRLRITQAQALKALAQLVEARLVDKTPDGGYAMHDWGDWQYEEQSPAGAARNLGNHNRWHLARGVTDPACRYCQDDSIRRPSGVDKDSIRRREGVDKESKKESLQNTDTETDTETDTDTAVAAAAKAATTTALRAPARAGEPLPPLLPGDGKTEVRDEAQNAPDRPSEGRDGPEAEGARLPTEARTKKRRSGLVEPQGSNRIAPEPRPVIFELYENAIGSLSPLIVERLKEAEFEYSEACIRHAFEEAVSHNHRSWAYVEAIMRRHKETGDCYAGPPMKAGAAPRAGRLSPEFAAVVERRVRGFGHPSVMRTGKGEEMR